MKKENERLGGIMKCILCKKSTSLELSLAYMDENLRLENCLKFTSEYPSFRPIDYEFCTIFCPLLAVRGRAMGTNKLRENGLGRVSRVRSLSRVSNLREEGGFKNKTRILFIHSSKKLC